MKARSPQDRAARLLQIAPPRIVARRRLVGGAWARDDVQPGCERGQRASGIVIGIRAERMEMQNATGPATVAITDKIRVIRTVSGTVANLCRGQKAGLDSR
jgi:hypothetical protein